MRLAGCAALALIGATAVRPAHAGYVAQFQGANLSNSGFIPPDMGGAVGNGYVLQMLNGAVSTYTTSGTLVGSRQSLNAFWSGAGLGTAIGGTSVSDPRVIFDPSSGHWFASSISTQGTNNNILVAVSRTSDPTQGFAGYAIPAAGSNFADFPTLGVNNSAVTIGTNNFTSSTGSLVGSSVYSISKSALIDSIGSAQPPAVTRFDNTSAVGFTPQAVSNLTGTGTTTTLLSSNTATTFNVGTLSTGAQSITPLATVSTPYNGSFPTQAAQPGGVTYDSGDARISAGADQVGNAIYAVNTILNNADNLDTIQWEILNASTGALGGSGLIGISGLDLTYGSIAANANGTFVIAFNGSGSSSGQTIADYYVVCSSASFTCGQPLQDNISPAAANAYDVTYGSGINRWGDYSATVADPGNPNNFWLFQQYAATDSSWSTVITEIATVPEPASLSMFGGAVAVLAVLRRRRGHRAGA